MTFKDPIHAPLSFTIILPLVKYVKSTSVISSLKMLLLLFVVVVALKLDHSFTISYPRLDVIMTMRPHSCTSFDYDNFAVSILKIHSNCTSVINFLNCGPFPRRDIHSRFMSR